VNYVKRALAASLPNPVTNLGFMHILNDGFQASLPLLLPFTQGEMNLSFTDIGFLSSVLGTAGVALALPSSVIAQKFGGMRVIAVAMALYGSAFMVTGFSTGFFMLAAAFALASVGFGLFHPIGFALVAHGSSQKDIGKKMGNFTAVGDFGRVGMAAALTFLVTALSWRKAAFIYGAVPLLILGASLLFCRNPAAGAEDNYKKKAAGSFKDLLNGDFAIAILTGIIDTLASSSLFIFLPFLLLHRGIPGAFLGSMAGAFFVGNMLGKVFIGRAIDKVGGIRVFFMAELMMAGLLVWLSATTSVILLVGLSVVVGAVTKGTVPVIYTLVTNSVKDRGLYEKAFSVVSFTNGLAGVITPVFFGALAERSGITSVFVLSAVLAVAAIVPLGLRTIIRHA